MAIKGLTLDKLDPVSLMVHGEWWIERMRQFYSSGWESTWAVGNTVETLHQEAMAYHRQYGTPFPPTKIGLARLFQFALPNGYLRKQAVISKGANPQTIVALPPLFECIRFWARLGEEGKLPDDLTLDPAEYPDALSSQEKTLGTVNAQA